MVVSSPDVEVGALLRSSSRVFLIKQRAGPVNAPTYQGVMMAGPIAWPAGSQTRVEVPSPLAYGQFSTVAMVPGESSPATVTLTARFLKDLSDLLEIRRLGCPVDIQIHLATCKDPRDFNGYEKVLVMEAARAADWTTTELGALGSGDNAPIDESAPFEGANVYPIVRLTAAEVAATQVQNEVVAIELCDAVSCGECEDPSTGCEKVFAIQQAAGGSPGLLPELVFTVDGGGVWFDTLITTLAANEEPTDLACASPNVLVVSNDSNSLHWAPKADIQAGTEVWTEMGNGFVVGGEPNSIFALSPREVKIAGDGGYIYGSRDPTAVVVVEDAGIATVEVLNDIHAVNSRVWVAVGVNNAVIFTLNGDADVPIWQMVLGPNVGVALNAIWVKTETEWWVGDAGGQLWYTLDQGANWFEKTFPGSGAGQVRAIKFPTDTVGFMSHDIATPAGRILKTIDGGYTWVIVPEDVGTIPANDQINDIAVCPGEPNVAYGGGLGDTMLDGIIVKLGGQG